MTSLIYIICLISAYLFAFGFVLSPYIEEATAIRLAKKYDIPVFNLAIKDDIAKFKLWWKKTFNVCKCGYTPCRPQEHAGWQPD